MLTGDTSSLSTDGTGKNFSDTIFTVRMTLTFCMYVNFSCFYCSLLSFQNKLSMSGTPSEDQMIWIQIRTDILSVLIWVQTVCKGYQQMTKVTSC